MGDYPGLSREPDVISRTLIRERQEVGGERGATPLPYRWRDRGHRTGDAGTSASWKSQGNRLPSRSPQA